MADLTSGIARVLCSDGKTAGAGFVVAEGLIVTCAHVIPPAAQPKDGQAGADVELVFRADGRMVLAEVVPEWFRPAEAEDVAFLRLREPLPEGVRPLSLGSSQGTAGHPFQTFGFPVDGPKEGRWGHGHIVAEIQLDSSEITVGFSGAPIFDTLSRRVVGMVDAIALQDRYGKGGLTAFMIPIVTMKRICPALALSDVQPYMGLAAFKESDAKFFFGRRREVERLLDALRREPRFLAVLGPSGSGKSSVVQAGLIPDLRQGGLPGSDGWGIISARPGEKPLRSLGAAGLAGAEIGLVEAARSWLTKNPEKTRLMLVLDQFEEIFAASSPADAAEFLRQLQSLLEVDLPLTLMLIMRDDFFSRLGREAPPALFEWVQRGFVHISAALEEGEIAEIIEGPAKKVGLQFEEGLVQVMVRDVLAGGERAGRSTVLPLLEFALTQMWMRRREGYLTHEAYLGIGGVTGSLTQWADRAYQALAQEGLGDAARRVLTELVSLGDERQGIPDSRRRLSMENLGGDPAGREAAGKVVKRLADARLVATSFDPQSKKESVEIINDTLIQEWGRLRVWLQEDRSFLSWDREMEKRADAWEEGKHDDGRLLRGLDLDEAQRWLELRSGDIGQKEQMYIQSSLSLQEREIAEKERRRTRNMRYMAAFSIAALIISSIAIFEWNQANQKTEEVLARSLASQSEHLRGVTGSLRASILLAVESLRHKETLEGEIALRRSFSLLPRCEAEFIHPSGIDSGTISPGGSRLATICWDNAVRLWDLKNNSLSHKLKHNDSVNDAIFSSNGHILATSCDDHFARIWDVKSGILLKELEHSDDVNEIAFSPDMCILATASDNLTILWDVKSGNQLKRFEHGEYVMEIAISPDGNMLVTADDDDIVRLWNITTGKVKSRLEDIRNVDFILFSRDGNEMAIVCEYETVRIWDARNLKEYGRIEHSDEIEDIAFSPDGRKLATASADMTARIWNAKTCNELQRFLHEREVVGVAFSPDGHKLATACSDRAARLWDLQTGKVIQRMEHNREVIMVAFTPDGSKLATSSLFPSAYLWDIKNGISLQRFEHVGSVISSIFAPNGSVLATAGSDDIIRLWDVKSRRKVASLKLDNSASGITFSQDGSKMAAVWNDKSDDIWNETVHLWDIATGSKLNKLRQYHRVNDLAFSSDSSKLAVACGGSMVRLWDINGGIEIRNFTDKSENSVDMVAFRPDGRKIASAHEYGNKVLIWDADTGIELLELNQVDSDMINEIVFSPDGKKIAIASYSFSPSMGHTLLWDAESGKLLHRFKDDYDVNTMVFTPDGKKLATASSDRAVHLWDVGSGNELKKLEHDHSVRRMAFSPDGHNLATAGNDEKMAHLWDINSGREVQRLEHDGVVRSVAFSPDGKMLTTASEDGTARVWMLDINQVIEEACGRLMTNMTRDEWTRFIADENCQTCPAEGSFNQSSTWPWERQECQPCIAEAFANRK